MRTLNQHLSTLTIIVLLPWLAFVPKKSYSQAPQFWGMTYQGGKVVRSQSSAGNIFTTSITGKSYSQRHAFAFQNPGFYPNNPMNAENGYLYGTTESGGSYGYGVIYQYNPISNQYLRLYDFDGTSGGGPVNNLVFYNGKFYGAAGFGGKYSNGVIFSFDPVNRLYTDIYDLNYSSDGELVTGLTLLNGLFYGTTYYGGTNDRGILFSFNPSLNVFSKLYDFDSENLAQPTGVLTEYNGSLFGTTINGGTNNTGAIFSYDTSSKILSTRYDFEYTTSGIQAFNGLVNFNGALYGETSAGSKYGAGAIFSYQPDSDIYNSLSYFNDTSGIAPSGLTVYTGKLYGSTYNGGSYGKGVLFMYDPATNADSILFNFQDSSGTGILTPLNNKLYGFIPSGGLYRSGRLINYDLTNNLYSENLDLNINDGGSPLASLTESENGKLYGTANQWGIGLRGVIFEFDPVTGAYSSLYNFPYNISINSRGSFIEYNHILYNLSSEGGSSNAGVIYSFDPATKVYTTLHNFTYLASKDGINPYGGLINYNNKFYGTTYSGGHDGVGVIFQFDPLSNIYKRLYAFTSADGANPIGDLLVYQNEFYGMTYHGGQKDRGVIFMYDSATKINTKLFDFDIPGGYYPTGSLIAFNNKFYGVTSQGGSNNDGVIFQFDPLTKMYTVVYNFNDLDGIQPLGTLTAGSDMKLYGTTHLGGKNNYGVIFQFDPATNTFLKIKDLDLLSSGAYPQYGKLIELANSCATPTGLQSIQKSSTSELLQWDSIIGASGYQVNVYNDSFQLIQSKTAATASFVFKKMQPNTKYRWQVATLCLNGLASKLSTVDSFSTQTILNAEFSNLALEQHANATTIYPNPARENVVISFVSNGYYQYNISLTDITGSVLQNKIITSTTGRNTIQLDIHQFSNGIYLITVTGANKKETIKLIKEN